MWIIRCKKTHRAYVEDSFSRLYDDFRPEYEREPDNYSRAARYATKESAEWVMKNWLHDSFNLEAIELPDSAEEAKTNL